MQRLKRLIPAALVVLACAGGVYVYQNFLIPDQSGKGCFTPATDSMPAVAGMPDGLFPTPGPNTRLTSTSCTSAHQVEVIGYTDDKGDEAGCRRTAEEYLGGSLDASRVGLVPLHSGVDGLYPCAIAELGDTRGHLVERRAALRDGLRGGRPLAITCVATIGGDDYKYVGCDRPHAGELVGVVADDGRPEAGCAAVAAEFIGAGFTGRGDLEVRWVEGEDQVVCFAIGTDDDNTMHATLQGLGAGPLPR